MKKYTKFLALMGAALAMGACQDDEIISPVKHALPGDEIVFGATGVFESGDKDANPSLAPGVRTVYDKVWTDADGNKFIQVKWVPGVDRMDILCPQSATAGNVKNAQYKVATTNSGDKNDSIASTLQRMGDAGLQWSSANEHHFYAAYPSKEMVGERLQTVIPNEISELGLSTTAEGRNILRGYLPVNQTPKVLPGKDDITTRDGKVGYVIEPDMTFAYMVASDTINTTNNAPASVGLQFESQVTALEFEIVASEIVQSGGGNTESFNPEIKILGVSLSHANGEKGEVTQISGHFEYDFESGEFANVDVAGADAHTSVSQTFPEGYTIDASKGFVDVTFFLFPGVNFNEGNDNGRMKLTVLYQVDGVPLTKTATLIKKIQPKKKYFFSNVKLPAIKEESVSASNWFNALHDKILFNQVSIPVASNVFANPEYAKTSVDEYTTQQTQRLKELWNMGVRGFELCNQSSTDSNESPATVQSESLDGEGMVASEKVLDFTFRQAIDTLYQCFINSNSKEPLILICTYASSNDGYNPYHYVANLFNSLESFCKRNEVGDSTFVQIKSSTTTADIKGKIAIVIRPGDDERWLSETDVHNASASQSRRGVTTDPYAMLGDTVKTKTNSPYGLTNSIKDVYKSKWWSRVLMVSDWGVSSWDNWHRRGSSLYYYASTATNYDAIESAGRTPISNKENGNGGKYEDGIIANNPAELSNVFHYEHDMSNGATAYIQDFVRVIDKDLNEKELTLTYKVSFIITTSQTKDVKISWKESLKEKKAAIDGLFMKSVKTKGDTSSRDLYINVLSSYYPTDSYNYINDYQGGKVSFYPSYDSQTFKKAGRGGDYKSAAKDLTTYVYGILSGTNDLSSATGENKKLAQGPWGLVMIDYIGDGTNNPSSRNLVNLIMLNNFKFALAKTQGVGTETEEEGKTD